MTEPVDSIDFGLQTVSLIPLMDKSGKSPSSDDAIYAHPRSMAEHLVHESRCLGTKAHHWFTEIARVFNYGQNEHVSENYWRSKRCQIANWLWSGEPKSFTEAISWLKSKKPDVSQLLKSKYAAIQLMDETLKFEEPNVTVNSIVSLESVPGMPGYLINLLSEKFKGFKEAMAEAGLILSFHEIITDSNAVWFPETVYNAFVPQNLIKMREILENPAKRKQLAGVLNLKEGDLRIKLGDWIIKGKNILEEYPVSAGIGINIMADADDDRFKHKLEEKKLDGTVKNQAWAVRRILLSGLEMSWFLGGAIFTEFREQLQKTDPAFIAVYDKFVNSVEKSGLEEYLLLASTEGRKLSGPLKTRITDLLANFPLKEDMPQALVNKFVQDLTRDIIFRREQWFATLYGFRLDWFGIKKSNTGSIKAQEKALGEIKDYRSRFYQGEKRAVLSDPEFQRVVDKAVKAGCRLQILEVKTKTGVAPAEPLPKDIKDVAVNINQFLALTQGRAVNAGKLAGKSVPDQWTAHFAKAILLYIGMRWDGEFGCYRPDIRQYDLFNSLRLIRNKKLLAELRRKWLESSYLRHRLSMPGLSGKDKQIDI